MSLTFPFHQPEKQLYSILVTSGQMSIEFQGQGPGSASLRFTNESGLNFYWTIGQAFALKIIESSNQAMDGSRLAIEDDHGDDRLTLFFTRRGGFQVDVIGCDVSTDFFAEMSFEIGLWQPFIDAIRSHFLPSEPDDTQDLESDPFALWKAALNEIDWD